MTHRNDRYHEAEFDVSDAQTVNQLLTLTPLGVIAEAAPASSVTPPSPTLLRAQPPVPTGVVVVDGSDALPGPSTKPPLLLSRSGGADSDGGVEAKGNGNVDGNGGDVGDEMQRMSPGSSTPNTKPRSSTQQRSSRNGAAGNGLDEGRSNSRFRPKVSEV